MGTRRVPAMNDPADRITLMDRVVGTFVLVGATATVMAGRSTVIALVSLALMALAVAYIERNAFRTFLRPSPAALPVAAFLSLGVLSAAWSVDGVDTLQSTLTVLLIFILWHIVDRWLRAQPIRRVRHMAYWFVVAVALGMAFLTHEVFAEQYIRRWLVDTFGIFVPPTLGRHYSVDQSGSIRIKRFEPNRSIAVLNMYLWPAILCAYSLWSGRKFALIAAILGSGAVLATMGSVHETSKLALIGGVLCFGLASLWRRAAFVAVACSWVVLGLAMVPAAHFAHDELALHRAEWLQPSAQRRIEIWDDIADGVAQSPLVGMGVRSAHGQTFGPAPSARDAEVGTHAHNVYLQNWYELGVAGVLLFIAAGLVVLNSMRGIARNAQPYALAAFTAFMVEIGSSWELWQRWFAALFALAMIYLLLGIRSAEGRSERVVEE